MMDHTSLNDLERLLAYTQSDGNENDIGINVHFFDVYLDPTKVAEVKEELASFLRDNYPDIERFKQGLSYIEVGCEVGDQGIALRLFALGVAAYILGPIQVILLILAAVVIWVVWDTKQIRRRK